MKKVSLRDLTLEQYKEIVNNNCAGARCNNCIFRNVICYATGENCWVNHKELYSDKFLNQEIEIEEPLLNEEEKDFIKDFIKKHINKNNEYYGNFTIRLIKRGDIRTLWFYKKYHTRTTKIIEINRIIPIVEYNEIKEFFICLSAIDYFNQLEMDREYTMEELGIELEENNED